MASFARRDINLMIANFKRALLPLIIMGISLGLIAGIGIGDAYKTVVNLKIEGVYALGKTVQSVVDSFLGSGVSLKQFTGFGRISSMIVASDPSITGVSIIDNQGKPVFSYAQKPWELQFTPSTTKPEPPFTLHKNSDFFLISIPLSDKFEKAGKLQLVISKASIKKKLITSFRPVFALILLCCLIFPGQIFFIEKKQSKLKQQRMRITLSYAFSILIISGVVFFSLIQIYNQAIQEKTHNLTNSMTHKLSYIKKLGLNVESFTGIDQLFATYQKANPEISFITLTKNDRLILKTNPRERQKNRPMIALTRSCQGLDITVGIDRTLIYRKLRKSSENFLILMVAAAFIAALFLNLMFNIGRQKKRF